MTNLTLFVLLIIFALSSADNERISNRMVGGSEARDKQFPYQVSIFDLFVGHICGGSILNEKWILSAARCVQGKRPSSFSIGAGITDWSDLPYAIYTVDKVIFDDSSTIALIKLKKSFTFSEYVNKIDLPLENMNVGDTSVVVSGWGALFKGGQPSRKLLFIQSKIYDLNACKERMAKLPKYPAVTDVNLCTFSQTGEGLCDRDSGNPVVAGNYQVGVALYGYPCARGYPDISANLWNYIDWIKSHINEQ